MYRKRTGTTASVGFDCSGSLSIQPFEGSRWCSRRALWDLNRLWFGSCWKEEDLRSECLMEIHRSLSTFSTFAGYHCPILARDKRSCKNSSFDFCNSSLQVSDARSSGTRSVRRASGFVQTAHAETISLVEQCAARLRGNLSCFG